MSKNFGNIFSKYSKLSSRDSINFQFWSLATFEQSSISTEKSLHLFLLQCSRNFFVEIPSLTPNSRIFAFFISLIALNRKLSNFNEYSFFIIFPIYFLTFYNGK